MRALWITCIAATIGCSQAYAAEPVPPALSQESNALTRYELLAPKAGTFRIIYDATQTKPGATTFFNPIRKGSVSTDENVSDRATGEALKFSVVHGADIAKNELESADPSLDYIRVELARPVPDNGGEGRIRIEKTYEDAKSYYLDGHDIVFDRTLYVKRNEIVLPAGYVLVSCNYPAQLIEQEDGRLAVSVVNVTPADAPLKLRAAPVKHWAAYKSSEKDRLKDRATQTRNIVYFLRAPETHAFDLYHDYTEERAGISTYVNVVRTGSTVANPSARDLDTGADIPPQILKGDAIKTAGIVDEALKEIRPDTEIVVFRFPENKAGHSIRLRMSETYTDPDRYKLVGDELVFDRTLGRPVNTVVLPPGWQVTNSAVPGTLSKTEDGRERLDFLNPRLDEISVLITARRIKKN